MSRLACEAIPARPDTGSRVQSEGLLGRYKRPVLLLVLVLACTPPVVAQPDVTGAAVSPAAQAQVMQLLDRVKALVAANRLEEAIQTAEQLLHLRENIFGADHPQTARSLLTLGMLHQRAGHLKLAEPLLVGALALWKRFPDKPQLQIQALTALGVGRYQTGQFASAEANYRQAAAEASSAHLRQGEALALNNLAWLYNTLGRYGEAEPLARRALELWQKPFAPTSPAVYSLYNLADSRAGQGDYTEAKKLHTQTLAIRRQGLPLTGTEVAWSLQRLVRLSLQQGDYALAERRAREGLAVLKTTGGRNRIETTMARAMLLLALANIHWLQGEPAQTETEEALRLLTDLREARHYHTYSAWALEQLAAQRPGSASAVRLSEKAVELLEATFGPTHPNVASALNDYGWHLRLAGRAAEAETTLRRALAALKSSGAPDEVTEALLYTNLAEIHQARQELGEAEKLHLQSVTLWQKLKLLHPRLAYGYSRLAQIAISRGDSVQALEYTQLQMQVEEQVLSLSFADGNARRGQRHAESTSQTTDRAIFLQQRAAQNPAFAQLVLERLLRRKGRLLDTERSQWHALRRHLDGDGRASLDRLAALRARLATLFFQPPPGLSGSLREEAVHLAAQIRELEAQLARRSAAFRAEAVAVSVEAVRQNLPADAALVEFVRWNPPEASDTRQPSRYAVYTLTGAGRIGWADLGEARSLERLTEALRRFLRDPNVPIAEVHELARSLDERLMRPVRALLGSNTRHLVISPDGPLHLLPFAALVAEDRRYLFERYTLTHLNSGRDLVRLAEVAPPQSGPLVIASPDFDHAAPDGSPPERRIPAPQTLQGFARFSAKPLPGAAAEGQLLHNLLPKARVLTGKRATENALKAVHGPSLLHVATHGFFTTGPLQNDIAANVWSANPLLHSGLLLAGFRTGRSGPEDGVLTALEAEGLDLMGTALVVLSACDSGMGRVNHGDGIRGLRSALVKAGAQSQLISLWKVNDRATRELMMRYYRALLLEQRGRSQALESAQRLMIADPRYRHPFYWAAFVPSGDWRPLPKSVISARKPSSRASF